MSMTKVEFRLKTEQDLRYLIKRQKLDVKMQLAELPQ